MGVWTFLEHLRGKNLLVLTDNKSLTFEIKEELDRKICSSRQNFSWNSRHSSESPAYSRQTKCSSKTNSLADTKWSTPKGCFFPVGAEKLSNSGGLRTPVCHETEQPVTVPRQKSVRRRCLVNIVEGDERLTLPSGSFSLHSLDKKYRRREFSSQ